MTTEDDRVPWGDEGSLSTEELARRQGVTHIATLAELAQPGLFKSDEEYEAFRRPLRLPPRRPGVTRCRRRHRRRLHDSEGSPARPLDHLIHGRRLAITFVTVGELSFAVSACTRSGNTRPPN